LQENQTLKGKKENQVILKRLFRKNPYKEAIESLYVEIMAQVRKPVFYVRFGIADTLDGRFEVLILHVFLVVHRLRGESGREEITRQLPEKMLHEIDLALRETGVSDMGVPRRVKTMAKAFLGRATAYEDAMQKPDAERLVAALARNVFSDKDKDMHKVSGLAKYMRAANEHLNALRTDDICAGKVSFPDPGDENE